MGQSEAPPRLQAVSLRPGGPYGGAKPLIQSSVLTMVIDGVDGVRTRADKVATDIRHSGDHA
ncbi:hypothetical protein CHELA40_11770 [Chelatococcus asaccharovorans]|nr:hypothetical protein CHELA40_11770 [Chelatococcus asaccharovorans]CAH1684103.1 hypothetical protein CHELA17_63832 [Chelatococcus asaccharovorans]